MTRIGITPKITFPCNLNYELKKCDKCAQVHGQLKIIKMAVRWCVYDSCGTKPLANTTSLRWRHNGHDCVLNHQPHHCLFNRLVRRRSKKTSKLRVAGLCAGIHRSLVNSPHKWPVTRKMFPFDDVIMAAVGVFIVDVYQECHNVMFHMW